MKSWTIIARRAPYRAEHLRAVGEARARGELILAGALADPADQALLVFHAPDRALAEDFARRDPYAVAGAALVRGRRPPASRKPRPTWSISPGRSCPLCGNSRATGAPSC